MSSVNRSSSNRLCNNRSYYNRYARKSKSYLSLCNCGVFVKRTYYNRFNFNRYCMQRTCGRKSVNQHSIRHSKSLRTQKNISNDVRNCKYRLRKKILRKHENYTENTNVKITIETQYEAKPKSILRQLLEIDIKLPKNVVNGKKARQTPETKSEIGEKTEQNLQGIDELNIIKENNNLVEPTIKGNDRIIEINDEIIENITANEPQVTENSDEHITKRIETILEAYVNDLKLEIAKEATPSDSKQSNGENTSSKELNIVENSNEQITKKIEKILEAYVNNLKLEVAKNVGPNDTDRNIELSKSKDNIESKQELYDPATNDLIGEKISNTTRDIVGVENEKAVPQFDDFKIPNEITNSKKTTTKQQKQFVLTHVVEGFIIQESNFAFPIIQPQRNKTTSKNLDKEEEVPPEITEKEEETAIEEDNGELNPFARLQHSTVKSWTVEDLSNHLLKFDWNETALYLRDNEVDGASLFLVTKAQLGIIGVVEEHADVICEFVQSGPSNEN